MFILIFLFNTTLIFQSEDIFYRSSLSTLITTTKHCLTMGVLLKLLLSSCVIRKTRDLSMTANATELFLLGNVSLFNTCTASVCLNAQSKHKAH